MAFNAGEESVGYKLYTGLTDVVIVAVNPTKEEAEKIGITMKNDPVYLSTDEESGNKKVRVDVYVKSEQTNRIDKLAFFFEDATRVSTAGNKQYINDFGQSTWADSPESATARTDKNGNQWYKADGLREAISGEPEFVDFIINYLNIGRGQIAKLDNVKALFTGNVSEISAIFSKYSTRKVQVLYTVRENDGTWYQGIYSRFFSRAGNKTTKWWEKHFEGSTSIPNYQNNFLFQEFNPLSAGNTDETKSVGDAPKSIWGS